MRFTFSSVRAAFALSILTMMIVVLISCTTNAPVCSSPYIPDGKTCCLDKNNDTVCDGVDRAATPDALDCKLCPPQFVTQKEDVIVYKYVCPNQTVVDNPSYCGDIVVSNAHLFTPSEVQDPAYVALFSAEPACRGAVKAAELHLQLTKVPLNITLEVENSPDALPQKLFTVTGKDDLFAYVGFCDNDCGSLVDAQLPPTSAYLARFVLRYDEKTIATKEIVMDPTPEGIYGKKRCN